MKKKTGNYIEKQVKTCGKTDANNVEKQVRNMSKNRWKI